MMDCNRKGVNYVTDITVGAPRRVVVCVFGACNTVSGEHHYARASLSNRIRVPIRQSSNVTLFSYSLGSTVVKSVFWCTHLLVFMSDRRGVCSRFGSRVTPNPIMIIITILLVVHVDYLFSSKTQTGRAA